MSKRNDDFFTNKKKWSETKDTLLGCYLKPYFEKIKYRKNQVTRITLIPTVTRILKMTITSNIKTLNKRKGNENESSRNINYRCQHSNTYTTTCHANRKLVKKKLQNIKYMHANQCICMDIFVIFMECKKSRILDKM